MKILHINGNFLCTKLHNCLLQEADKLCENTVYVPRKENQLKVLEACENVIPSICYNDFDRFLFYRKSRKVFLDLEQKINASDFDMVHAYTLFSDGDLAYRLYLKYKLPYVVAVRNTDVNLFFKYRKNLAKRGIEILKNASAIVFLSDGYRQKVLKKYVPEKLCDEIRNKTVVIPNGIDDFWHNNKNCSIRQEDKTVNVACVGAIDKNKNILTLIKALEKLMQAGYDVRLDIAGRPTDKKLLSKIEACNFAKYHGCIDKEKLIDIYRSADVFVLPSLHETFGLVYVEAMSQGLPVVYTRGEGFDGQFPEGEVGYSVNPLDPSDIADKIIASYENRAVLSENAVSAIEKFRWSAIAQRYADLYKKQFK